jgi:hypothetical protein
MTAKRIVCFVRAIAPRAGGRPGEERTAGDSEAPRRLESKLRQNARARDRQLLSYVLVSYRAECERNLAGLFFCSSVH